MRQYTFCSLGDSITAGIGLSDPDLVWPAQMARTNANLIVHNLAVGGQNSKAGLMQAAKAVQYKPDIVSIQFGMNDHCLNIESQAQVDIRQFRSNLEEMARMLGPKIKLLFITNHLIIEGGPYGYYYARHPQNSYLKAGGANRLIQAYNAVVRSVASQGHWLLADMEMIANQYPQERFLRNLTNVGTDDGVHPSDFGAEVYTRCIGEIIGYLLADESAFDGKEDIQ